MRPERRTEWEALNRSRIQEAVVRLLSRHGAEALTMDRVAEEADVAKGTLYVYFKDKESLLQSVKDASLGEMRKELSAILDGDLPPEQKLEKFLRRQLGYFDEHRDFLRVLLWDRQVAEAHQRRRQTERYQAWVQRLAAVFQEGSASGIFRPLNPEKVAAVFLEAGIAMVQQRLSTPHSSPLGEDVELLLTILFGGVRRAGAGDSTP
jgi:AcrR family transcriptional regulator